MANIETTEQDISLDDLLTSDKNLNEILNTETKNFTIKKLGYNAGKKLAKTLSAKLYDLQVAGIPNQSNGSLAPPDTMSKEDYVKMLKEKKWETYSKVATTRGHKAEKLMNVNLDGEKLLDWSIENFDKMTHDTPQGYNIKGRYPMEWWTEDGLTTPSCQLSLELKQIVGSDIYENKFNLIPETVNIDLICKVAGMESSWHMDSLSCYGDDFLKEDLDDEWRYSGGQVAKYWMPVFDWSNGHILQMGDTVLHGWKSGDVYEVKPQVGHGATCFGLAPFYSLTVIGVVKDSK